MQPANDNVASTGGKNNSSGIKQTPSNDNSQGTTNNSSITNTSSGNNITNGNNSENGVQGSDTIAKNNADTSIIVIPNAKNLPTTFGYHKSRTTHEALLDSLANAVPKPKTSDKNSSKHSKNQIAVSVNTVQYTDSSAAYLDQKAQNYFTAAASLVDNAEKIRSKAQGESDKIKSQLLYNKADSLDDLIFQLNLKGDETVAEANYKQYCTNLDQLGSIEVKADKSELYKVTAAKRLLKDADNSYRRSLSERDRANTANILANKHTYIKTAKQDLATAILRQQSAVYLFFQVDSDQTAGSIGRSNSDSNMHFTYSDFIKNKSRKASVTEQHLFGDNSGNKDNGSPENSTSNIATSGKNGTNQNTGNSESMSSANPLGNSSSSENTLAKSSTTSANHTRRNSKKDKNNSTTTTVNATTNPSPAIAKAANSGNTPGAEPATLAESGNVFEEVRRSPYSASNPIPIDPELPSGLIFKVQVGAFKNAIPQNLFQGFQPIIGLTAPEGYIRYSAGLFRVFNVAKDALGKIRGLGYPDAFLIAFYDGKRITIAEALSKLGISPPPVVSSAPNDIDTVNNDGNQVATTATDGGRQHRRKNVDNTTVGSNVQPGGNNVASSGDNKIVVVGANTIVPTKKALIDDRKRAGKKIRDTVPPNAKALKDIRGLVYTVQVGSFPKHKDFTRLKKIKELYTSVDENGTIKYSCGTYSSMEEAKAAKNIILANSYANDAFITAYNNGKRISLARAAELLKNNEAGETAKPASPAKNTTVTNAPAVVSKTISPEDKLANTGSPEANNSSEDKSSGKEDIGSFAEASKNRVIYTVQIASFTGELPLDIANKILMYADEGIEPHSEKHGVTSYYAGKYTDYDSANTLQQKAL